MTALTPNSAADMSLWMDRLSDRLGSLIPGGSRWPPRHPVKVSLVMGVLGIAAGWGTFGLLFLTEHLASLLNGVTFFDHWWLWPIVVPLPAFAVSGVLLVLPLAYWSRQGRLATWCSLPFTIASHYAFLAVLIFYDDAVFVPNLAWNGILVMTMACLPVAFTHAVAAAVVTGRRVAAVIASATVIPSLCGSISLSLYEDVSGSLSMDDFDFLLAAIPFTMFFSTLAVCLGVSLWDATPRPIFEPTEPT